MYQKFIFQTAFVKTLTNYALPYLSETRYREFPAIFAGPWTCSRVKDMQYADGHVAYIRTCSTALNILYGMNMDMDKTWTKTII
jgi:hypothetical protein